MSIRPEVRTKISSLSTRCGVAGVPGSTLMRQTQVSLAPLLGAARPVKVVPGRLKTGAVAPLTTGKVFSCSSDVQPRCSTKVCNRCEQPRLKNHRVSTLAGEPAGDNRRTDGLRGSARAGLPPVRGRVARAPGRTRLR